MKKVIIAELGNTLYVFESIYDFEEFERKYKIYFESLSQCEYEVVNSDGLMIKYKKI